jgi:hypothetical protein
MTLNRNFNVHKAKARIQSLIDESIAPILRRAQSQRKAQDAAKRSRDSVRIMFYPPIDMIKREVKKAMATISVIHKYAVDRGLLEGVPFEMRLEVERVCIRLVKV